MNIRFRTYGARWDHFIFAQEWPQTACTMGKKEEVFLLYVNKTEYVSICVFITQERGKTTKGFCIGLSSELIELHILFYMQCFLSNKKISRFQLISMIKYSCEKILKRSSTYALLQTYDYVCNNTNIAYRIRVIWLKYIYNTANNIWQERL